VKGGQQEETVTGMAMKGLRIMLRSEGPRKET